MSRSISTILSVVGGLWLAACGGPEPQPLSAFTAYRLSAGTQAWVKDGGGVDPDYNKIAVILYPPPHEPSVPYSCLAISPKVTATLNGEVMRSYTSGPALGGCTEPLFTLTVPKDRYGAQGGDASFIITDDTHTMIAEFKDFFLPKTDAADTMVQLLPVLTCEGVAECKSYKAARQYAP